MLQLKSQSIIWLFFPHFLFSIWFCIPSKKRPLNNCFLVVTLKEAVTLKDTNLPFRSVLTSVRPSRPRWSRTSNLFVWISPGEKKMAPNQLFFIWCIWSRLIWASVKILTFFGLVSANLKCQILFQGISDVTKIVISCCNHWKFREKRSLMWLHISFYNEDYKEVFKVVKKNTFLWKKINYYKNMNFARKKFILWIFDEENLDIMDFWE